MTAKSVSRTLLYLLLQVGQSVNFYEKPRTQLDFLQYGPTDIRLPGPAVR